MTLEYFLKKAKEVPEGKYIWRRVKSSFIFNKIYSSFNIIYDRVYNDFISMGKTEEEVDLILTKSTPTCKFIKGIDKDGNYYKFTDNIIYGFDFSLIKVMDSVEPGKKNFIFKEDSINCYCNKDKYTNGFGILVYIKYLTLADDAHYKIYVSPIDYVPLSDSFDSFEDYKELQDNLDLDKLRFAKNLKSPIYNPKGTNTKTYYFGANLSEETLDLYNSYVYNNNWKELQKIYSEE